MFLTTKNSYMFKLHRWQAPHWTQNICIKRVLCNGSLADSSVRINQLWYASRTCSYIWDVWWLTASWMLLWLTDWPFFSVCFPFLLTHSGQDNLCSPSDILQLNLSVKRTVETLLSLGTDSEESSLVSLSIQLWGFVVFYCTLMLTLCMFYRWVFFL